MEYCFLVMALLNSPFYLFGRQYLSLKDFANRNKKVLIVVAAGAALLALLVSALFVARTKTEVSDGGQWQRYESDKLGFSLSYPAGWAVTETAAASGPDIVVSHPDGLAFVRIRGFLDAIINSPESIQSSVSQYQDILTWQDGVTITESAPVSISGSTGHFSLSGEFVVDGAAFSFAEEGYLATSGQVLLLRALATPQTYADSLPLMQEIMGSFAVDETGNGAWLWFDTARADTKILGPISTLGDVKLNITDYQEQTTAADKNWTHSYASALESSLVSAGVNMQAFGSYLHQFREFQRTENQLNFGSGGFVPDSDQGGNSFWGYRQYGDLPSPDYRIDADISIRHVTAGGDRQDVTIAVNIFDNATGALVGQATAEQRDVPALAGLSPDGSDPVWPQTYVAGFNSPVAQRDIIKAVIAEAVISTVSQMEAHSNQELVSDADSFARRLKGGGANQPAYDEESNQQAASGDGTTAWGDAAMLETAYEDFFWQYVQHPDLFSNFWAVYNGEGEPGGYWHTLPLGEPVNLRVYFEDQTVRGRYNELRENQKRWSGDSVKMPPLDEFLANIDVHQAVLELPESEATPEVTPPADTSEIGDVCTDPAEYCKAIEFCARTPHDAGDGTILSYEATYELCRSGEENYFNDTCRLMERMRVSYNCPLEDTGCSERADQASDALQLPQCEPSRR